MVAVQHQYACDVDAAIEAAEHWNARSGERANKVEAARAGRFLEADAPEHLARWANRQISQMRDSGAMYADMPDDVAELVAAPTVAPEDIDDLFIERVIGATREFLAVGFLDRAVRAARAVGRIETELGGGVRSFGTGFLVSQRLLLTNHHVLKTPESAATSVVEFDYQLDYMNQPLVIQRFTLDPGTFFLNDKALDFALVAVKGESASGRALTDYGCCPLIGEVGKTKIDDPINIVQHPKGEMKQIVIRENKLLFLFEDRPFAHYEADTEPGSSGSPVFNDHWEVIALHHSGVPEKDPVTGELKDKDGNVWRRGDDPTRLKWVANEGVRVSKLVEFIRAAAIAPAQQPLREELLNPQLAPAPPAPASGRGASNGSGPEVIVPVKREQTDVPGAIASVALSIPLEVTVTVGTPVVAGAAAPSRTVSATVGIDDEQLEKVEPDSDYADRPGFDPRFLGFPAPLPKLRDAAIQDAFEVGDGANRHELRYHHYSVVFNAARKLAFVSAVNYDPSAPVHYERTDKDKWYFDPRVPEELQAGEELYAGNPLDRGHLTRRADAGWGTTTRRAKLANDDTFHFTNCTPQHEVFNQSALASRDGVLLWGNIENHISKQADNEDRRLSIFNGPVFQPNDRRFKDVQLPRRFWKVVAYKNDAGKPAAVAFVLSQNNLLRDIGPEEEFAVGPFQPFQVKISEIERLTNLDFGTLKDGDPLELPENEAFLEAETGVHPLMHLSDMVLA
jgi:endonuclease G